MTFTFAETKPGSGLCKPGTIALFGNVVYSDLLNEHLWHFGLPVITRLVSFFFSSCLIFLLLPVYCELLLLIWICTWSPRVEMYSLHSSCKTSNIITHTDTQLTPWFHSVVDIWWACVVLHGLQELFFGLSLFINLLSQVSSTCYTAQGLLEVCGKLLRTFYVVETAFAVVPWGGSST